MSTMKLPKPAKRAQIRKAALYQALEAIETIVGDDQCEIWAMENASRRFSGRVRLMHEKLAAVYRIAHSAQPTSCYHVHDDWRAEAASYGRERAGETR